MNKIRIYKTVMVAVLLGMASVCLSQGDTWTQKAPMPTARALLSSSVVDGKIYAIGGRQYSSSSASSAVEQYDPATDTWTTKAPMPTARQWLSTSAVNGKIYAFGGTPRTYQPALSTVEEYDPATDTWTEKASMPTARFVFSTSAVDGKIYAIGGVLRATTGGAEPRSSAVEAYDPATDTWTTKTPMPTTRAFLATSVVNGKIYAIGGALSGGSSILSTVEEYDPATDTWATKTSMPTRRTTVLAASAVNGIIYVIGGVRFGSVISTVEAYDPATDTWTEKTPMPRARGFLATSAVNGKIYAIGGSLGDPWSGISRVEEYDRDDSPFVDRRMDHEYLAVLAENWLADYRLIAHWKLDETEGAIAHDSVGENDGTIYGEPLWQPTSGKVNGALQFDGIDDHVHTDSPLGPMDLSLSVFAWVKGGAPGRVIISQPDRRVGRFIEPGSTWLGIDPADGRLMTKLLDPLFDPLESDSLITDGQWHHVGLVYDFDGLHRRLYVDGAEVAKDTDVVAGLLSDGELYFGAAGKDLDTGSFFSGLIDDVRIYNQALSAKEIEELPR
jgi:N-acetylneuraminic acid mutarotase